MRRRVLLIALKLGISAGLIAWLWTRFDFAAALVQIRSFDPGPAVAAFAILLLHGVLSAWRWRTVLKIIGGALPWRAALRMFFISMFFNQTLSTTVGGDAARVWMLRAGGMKVGAAATGIILERAAGLLALAVLLPVGLALIPETHRTGLWVLLAAAGGLALAIVFGTHFTNASPRWLNAVGRFAMTARRVLLSAAGLGVLTQSVLIHLGAGTAVYLLSHAGGASPGLAVCLTLTPPVLLLATLPISFSGWGMREAALVWLFAPFGVAAAPALAVSVAFGILVMAAGLPGAVLWVSAGRSIRAASTGSG